MVLSTWATDWGIHPAAIEDLRQRLGVKHDAADTDTSESAVQNQARLEYSRSGGRIWRNNVGATYTPDGKFLRYGLANDSKRVNQRIKSSDLIGLRPVLITAEHIGSTIGQFVAIECKHGGWRWGNTDREKAQLRFLELVMGLGGFARFYTGGNDARFNRSTDTNRLGGLDTSRL